MKEIKVSNIEDCFLIVSEKDYFKLKDFKWRYTKGGTFLTNIKKDEVWTSTTLNKKLNLKENNKFFLYKDGNILNISRSNRILLQKVPVEQRKNLRKLKTLSIQALDTILSRKIKQNIYRGVYLNRGNTKTISYKTGIYKNRKFIYLGTYKNPKEAGRVYDMYAKKIFKDRAILNFS